MPGLSPLREALQGLIRVGIHAPEGLGAGELSSPNRRLRHVLASRLSMGVDPTSLDAPASAPIYFSQLEKTVANHSLQSASPQQWLSTLQNTPGVKKNELEWSGLQSWLRGRNSDVSREEVHNYVRNNGVDVGEVMLGGPQDAKIARVADYADEDAPYYDHDTRAEAEAAIEREHDEAISELGSEYESDAFHDSYEKPEWEIIPHHPDMPAGYEHPDPSQPDMFGDPVEDKYPPGFYISDMNGSVIRNGIRTSPEHGVLPEEYSPENAPTYHWGRDRHYGPHETEAKAQDALEEMLAHHRESEQQVFRQSDAAHRASQQARQEFIERYLGNDGYTYPGHDGEEETPTARGPKWRQYAVPGGRDYGELVLTHDNYGGEGGAYPSHFEDVEGARGKVLGHVRFDTRTDVNGKKTLLLHELQTDLHASGRTGGYRIQSDPADIRDARARADDAGDATLLAREELHAAAQDAVNAHPELLERLNFPPSVDPFNGGGAYDVEFVNRALGRSAMISSQHQLEAGHPALPALQRARHNWATAVQEMNEANRAHINLVRPDGAVPNAPFKKEIYHLMLKRMMRFAADTGHEQLAWVNGGWKNGRFSGSQKGSAFYDEMLPAAANEIGKKLGLKTGRTIVQDAASNLDYRDAAERKAMQNMHSIALSPETRKRISAESFPLWAATGGYYTLLAEALREAMAAKDQKSRDQGA